MRSVMLQINEYDNDDDDGKNQTLRQEIVHRLNYISKYLPTPAKTTSLPSVIEVVNISAVGSQT